MVSQVTDLVLMSKDPLLLQIHRDVSGGTSEIKNLGTLPNVGLAAPGISNRRLCGQDVRSATLVVEVSVTQVDILFMNLI